MYPLRLSTASQEVPLGYFVDSTDGNTEETGLTIANTDIKLHKNGATTLANKNSGGATHISNGIYYTVLDATDTNTIGPMVIFCHVSGALAVRVSCIVYPAEVFDYLYAAAGTDYFKVDIAQVSGSAVSTSTAQLGVNAVQAGGTAWGSAAITAASIATGAITNAKFAAGAIDAAAIATDAIGAAELAADAASEIGTAVWATATRQLTGSQTFNVTGDITGNLSGSVGSVTGAVGSVTGAVGSVTGNVGGNVTGSVGSLAAQAKADVNAEVVDVVATDTYAEPGQGAPGATVSLAAKINYLYKAWRNRITQTADTYSLYNDDTTTVDQKATVSDNGTTFDRGEIATGP